MRRISRNNMPLLNLLSGPFEHGVRGQTNLLLPSIQEISPMSVNQNASLSKLSDTGQTVANADEDIRGRNVKAKDGQHLGKVDDLLIDDQARKVRFLRVEHGGI